MPAMPFFCHGVCTSVSREDDLAPAPVNSTDFGFDDGCLVIFAGVFLFCFTFQIAFFDLASLLSAEW